MMRARCGTRAWGRAAVSSLPRVTHQAWRRPHIDAFFFQAEDGIRDRDETGVQTCALPISVFTHTSHAGCKKCALEQLDILESTGANLRNVCIGHLSDIRDDPKAEAHKQIAKRGAFLGFDTVGHQLGQGDGKKVELILEVLQAGYEDSILLSSDFAAERETKFNGGAGYGSVTAVFLPKLRYAGVRDATIHKIMVENPKRFLAFVPKQTS